MTRRQTSGVLPSGTPTGLRERKKQRTREALLHAALELFAAQGYERTTVDEIAEAVEVSQRTFFRHFANKEAAAFAVQESVEARFLTELRQRPAGEAPFEALRRAALNAWNSIAEAVEGDVTVELQMRTYRMIESTPALLAAHLRRSVDLEVQTARLIAEREGLDPETDPRPRVAVAAFSGVMRLTGQLWGRRQDGGVDALRQLTELHLDHLGPALSGNWRAA
ncbi:TetR/AcrR family transcriptional regulator [Streptomyces sp. B1I3]|uniref:TetR/AcrR family transcriptional regulator n=1 Tax=Streptomyces sp. B1I3 TaxID=3042264 RepID=UPI0027872179|nr:TetR/AcrR family transcriptional regulator [Streptomyces sp. B1I3]MDQ0796590.1 AcrR family transcriptional regulator [Streptomyces sp. B1I3]